MKISLSTHGRSLHDFTKVFLLPILLFLWSGNVWGQTNPTAQALPYTQNFSTFTGSTTTYLSGWQGWKVDDPTNSFPTTPGTVDKTLAGGNNAVSSAASILDFNGKIGLISTGSNGSAIVLAINTTGNTSITVSYKIGTQRQATNERQGAVDLQYRVGTTGSFANLGVEYQNDKATNNTSGTGVINVVTRSINLPIAAEDKANVQLRWIYRDTGGSGGRPSFSIDDISVSGTLGSTITSTKTGNWSNPTTWNGGVVPTSSQNAIIATGHTVTMDSDTYATRNLGTTTVVNSGGTLVTSKTYINNGSTTIDGSFQLDAGGWVSDAGGTNALSYGTNGTLIFNAPYTANNGHYWPTTNGPVNVTVNTGSALTLGFARTVTGLLQSSSTITNPGNITIGTNGTLQLNAGYGFSGTGSPIYGSASLLKYNSGGAPGRAAEWTQLTGTVGTTAGLPQGVQISNNTTLNFPNGSGGAFKANGNLTIDSGSALYQNYSGGSAGLVVGGNLLLNGALGAGSSAGGDITVSGNWTQAAAATFQPNGRTVFFNGTIAQTIQKTGGGTIDFERIEINKTNATTVALSNAAGNLTDVHINGASGNVLALTGAGTGAIDLKGRALTFNNDGGFIYVDGAKSISTTVTTGATVNFNGSKVVANNAGVGSLLFAANVTINLNTNGVLDFGLSSASISTVNGILNINSVTNCYVKNNAPIYGATSKLIYQSGGIYGRTVEWSATSGAGYPYEVQVANNTTLNYPNTAGAAFSANLGIATHLTIDSGSSLYMDYGGGANKSGRLTIGGNLVNNGNFGLGSAVGGDLYLAGHWTKATGANFYPNERQVVFNGSAQQDLTGATIFDYLKIDKSGSYVNLAASSSITINKNIDFASRFINLGASSITLLSAATFSNAGTNGYACATGNGRFVRQSVGNVVTLFPVGVDLAGRYTPITLTNTTGTSDLGINLKTPISSAPLAAVYDNTKVVNLEWVISSSAATVTTVTPNWLNATYHGAGFNIANPGELGNYTTSYTTYPAPLSPYSTTATGVSLRNGLNSIVVGNQYAIIYPAPANDNCPGTAVTVGAAPITGDVAGATLSTTYTPFVTGPTRPNDDVWYSFNTSAAGNYTVKVAGSSSFDAVLEIRDACGQNIALAGKDGTGDGGVEELIYAAAANTTYYVRVYDYQAGVMPATTTFTIQVLPPAPSLSTNGTTALTFPNTAPGATSASQSFNLTGDFLTGFPSTITVSASSTYQVSSDNLTFGNSVNVTYTTASLALTPVYVRFAPVSSSCGATTGNVTFSGGGVTVTPTVALSANAAFIAPTASAGTDITATTFTANWNSIAGATGYVMDVSTNSNFGSGTSGSITEGFESATFPPTGWISTSWVRSTTSPDYNSGVAAASATSATGILATKVIANPTSLSFYLGRSGNTTAKTLTVEVSTTSQTSGFSTVATYDHSNVPASTYNQYNLDLSAYTSFSTVYIRFNKSSSTTSPWRLDDIVINYNSFIPSFVSPYNNYPVGNVTSNVVSGLAPNTQYYYRVRAANGSCQSPNSNTISATTNGTVVWNGNAWSNVDGPTAILNSKIIGAYAIPTSFETKDLEITSTGSLNIQMGKDVTVNGTITLPSDGKIILESDANLVQKNAGADNNSNQKITVKRTALLPTKGYTFWSSPVVGQNLYSFSNGYNQALGGGTGTPWNRFFVYKESTDTFVTAVSGEITLGSSSDFVPGRGYAIKGKNSYTPTGGTGTEVPALADTFVFDGKMNNGPIPSQLLKNSCDAAVLEASCTKGYNLIGNPYPSNLDFDALYTANNSKIYGTAYFWTNNDITATASQLGSNYSGNNYAVYNLTGGTPAVDFVDPAPGQPSTPATPIPNGTVKVGQGFIIKAKKAGTGSTLDFTNAMRLGYDVDAHFYNAKKPTKNRFWIKMTTPSHIVNTALVGYIPGATNGFEIDYDGELFVVGSDAFYSTLDGKKLIIQGKAEFVKDDVVPLGVKYAASGNYKISLGGKEGIFGSAQKIYLKDKITNTYTDLTSQDYTFSGIKGADENRFEIVYKNLEVLGTDAGSKSDFTVYRDGDSFVLRSSKSLGKIEIYDTSGRMLITSSTTEKSIKLDASVLSSGVYVIKAENSGDVKTKKIIK